MQTLCRPGPGGDSPPDSGGAIRGKIAFAGAEKGLSEAPRRRQVLSRRKGPGGLRKTDLSTEKSPINPMVCPQEIFILRCFFVARVRPRCECPFTAGGRKEPGGARRPEGAGAERGGSQEPVREAKEPGNRRNVEGLRTGSGKQVDQGWMRAGEGGNTGVGRGRFARADPIWAGGS